MFEIIIYEDEYGHSEFEKYLNELAQEKETNKDSRINYNKIIAYLDLLSEMGTRMGSPFTKHIKEEIWELRPLKNRILYAYYKDNSFVILHHFIKDTKKTPKREIEKAQSNYHKFVRAMEGTK